MSEQFRYISTLFYYDEIQIFEGQGSDGQKVIGTAVDESLAGDTLYLLIAASDSDVAGFAGGKIELLDLFRRSQGKPWWIGTLNGTADKLVVQAKRRNDLIPASYFPGAGLIIHLEGTPNA